MKQTVIQKKPVVTKSNIIRRSTDVSFDANQNKQGEPVLMGSSLFRSAEKENVSEEQIRTSVLFGSSCKPIVQSKEEQSSVEVSAENEIQKSNQEKSSEQNSILAKAEAFTGKEDQKDKEDAFSGSTGLSSQAVQRSEDDSEVKASVDSTITEDKHSPQKKEEPSFEENKTVLQSSEDKDKIERSEDTHENSESVQKSSEKEASGKNEFVEQKIQAKFTVGSADDHLEREADDTADKIVRMPEPTAEAENESKTASIQKFSIFRKLFRKKAEPDVPVVDEETASGIEMSRGMGDPLTENVSSFMGKRFGADFSNVRIHTDSKAGMLSKKIRAQAFTIGSDIYFGEGKFKPDTSDGKRLIAHELTHTIQQGSTPVKTGPVPVASRKIQRSIIDDIKGTIANYIPGYKLITVILGKDPISGAAVPRTSENIINGLISLVPGGSAIFKNLQESGAIARAGQWLDQEINKLNITWAGIKALISQAWDQISILNSFGTNIGIVKNIFAPLYNRIVAFASAIGSKLKEFVLEGALSLAGGAGKQVFAILNKGQAVFGAIISNPIGFASNLVGSVRQGVNQFAKNFLTHFKKSILDWIFGTIAASGITLPKKFDAYGIFSLVMQILGLSYKNIRAKFVKELGPKGEKVMSAVEKSVEILKDLVTKGPASLWDHIKEFVGNLTGTIIQKVSEWVAKTVVGQAILKLVSMLSPVGALIQSAIAIYNTVMFFIERAQQIAQFVSSVLNSIGNIAMGQIGAAANYIENAMASGLTMIISFLARFIGLGNIAEQIKKIIAAIRTPIDKALDKVVKTVVKKVRALYDKMMAIASRGAAAVKGGIEAVKKFLFPKTTFNAGEEKHTLSVKESENGAGTLIIASTPQPINEFLNKFEKDNNLNENKKELLKNARSLISGRIQSKLNEIKNAIDKKKPESILIGLQRDYLQLQVELSEILRQLIGTDNLKEVLDKYKLEGMVGTFGSMPKPTGDDLTADHQPQAAIFIAVSEYDIFDDTTIQEHAAKRADNGYAINLHSLRHKAGRTYGPKGKNTKNAFLVKSNDIVKSKKTKKQKRNEIIGLLKGELNEDVNAMLAVIKNPENWNDLKKYNLNKKDEKELRNKVQSQIEAGEATLKAQDLDSLKN